MNVEISKHLQYRKEENEISGITLTSVTRNSRLRVLYWTHNLFTNLSKSVIWFGSNGAV